MKGGALAIVIGTLAANTNATATPTPTPTANCDTTPLSATPLRPFTLYPIRHDELWVTTDYLGDWSHGHDASGGIDAEYVHAFGDDQRVRVGIGNTFQIGSWARGGSIAVIPALSFRGSVVMDDFFDFYVLAKAGVVLAQSGDAARGGVGFGARAGRLVELELSVDALAALGSPFAPDERWIPGFGVSLGLDLCGAFGGCAAVPRTEETKNFTCDLYQRAYDVCTSLAPTANADLCSAVEKAIDPDRFTPTSDEDSTDAFLRGLAASVTTPGLADAIRARLIAPHQALRAQRATNQETERILQQTKQSPAQHCRYMPYPAELRTALGCDTSPPQCQRVTCTMDASAP